jgi:hypothetical protein
MLGYILLFCIIVLAVILLLYYFKSEPLEVLKASNGTFDQPAAEALNMLDNPQTAEETVVRANIIRYNILEDGMTAEAETPEAIALGDVIHGYGRALLFAVHEPAFTFLQDVATLHDRLNLHAVFNGDGMADGMADAYNQEIEDEYMVHQIDMFNAIFGATVPVIQRNNINARVVEATKAVDRATAVATALRTEYRDDRQNVHDSKVNADLNQTLNKIAEVKDVKAELAELRAYIESADAEKKSRALQIFNIMAAGSPISTYNSTESYILAAVWCRSKHPRNAANSELMKEALVNAMADGIEGGSPVCINGRCARVLGSMVLLDFDESVGSAMTFDAYKNQIYTECKDIFDLNLQRAEISLDPDMKTLAESYKDTSVEAPEEAEEEFKQWLKEDIDALLEKYREKLNEREMRQVRDECYAFAMI